MAAKIASGSGSGKDIVNDGQEEDSSCEDMPGFPKMYVDNEMVKCALKQEQLPHSLRQRRRASPDIQAYQKPSLEAPPCSPPNFPNSNVKYSTPLAALGNQGGQQQQQQQQQHKWSQHFFWANNNESWKKKKDLMTSEVSATDSGFLDQSPLSTTTSSSTFAGSSTPECRPPPVANLHMNLSSGGNDYFTSAQSSFRRSNQGDMDQSIRKKLRAASKRLFSVDDNAGVLLQLWTDFKKRPHEIVPVIILLVVAASAVVSVFTLSNAMRRNPGSLEAPAIQGTEAKINEANSLNGKYKSIEYAHQKRLLKDEATATEAAGAPPQVLDEDGQPLGGKKASLKFGFDLRDNDQNVDGEEGQEDGAEGPEMKKDGNPDQEIPEDVMDLGDGEQLQKLRASMILLEEIKQVAQLLSKEDVPDQVEVAEEVPIEDTLGRKDALERLKAIKRPSLQPSNPPPGSFRGAKAAKRSQTVATEVSAEKLSESKSTTATLKKRKAPKTPNKALKEGPFDLKPKGDSSKPAEVKDEDDPFRM